MIRLTILVLVLLLLGCTTEQPTTDSESVIDGKSDDDSNVNEPEQTNKSIGAEKPLPQDSGLVDPLFCNTDSDCEIKDVHNCCGYYPQCVNKDFIPDIEAVIKECKKLEESGISSICGFPEIAYCVCVDNSCEGLEYITHEHLEPRIIE
jgi:hypothetical protein